MKKQKLKVWARVGCTFEVECEPTKESIAKAVEEQLIKIPFLDGDSYIPGDEIEKIQGVFEDVPLNASLDTGNTYYNYTHDVAMVTAIITEQCFSEICKLCNGSIDTFATIGKWAQEFCNSWNDTNTNWEKLLENPEAYGFPNEVCCWDEAVLWYAYKKIVKLKNQ